MQPLWETVGRLLKKLKTESYHMILCSSFNKRLTNTADHGRYCHLCFRAGHLMATVARPQAAPPREGCTLHTSQGLTGAQIHLLSSCQESMAHFHDPLFELGFGHLKHSYYGVTVTCPLASKSTALRFPPLPLPSCFYRVFHFCWKIPAWPSSGPPP